MKSRTPVWNAVLTTAALLVLAGCGVPAASQAPSPKAKATPIAPTATLTPQPAHRWVKVIALHGNGGGIIERSRRFAISGSEQRWSGVWYGDELWGMVSWGFVRVHHSQEDSSSPWDQGKFSEGKHLPAGTYYIFTNTANARWKVTLYDYR